MSIYDHFSDKELEILRARAKRAATALQEDQQEELFTALTVQVRQESYALPIETILNAHEGVEITPVPCVASYVTGIANIRGHIILVLDLGTLLGVPGTIVEAPAIVSVADDEAGVAFCVDAVGNVETLKVSSLVPVPGNIELRQSEHLRGFLSDGTALLDVRSLLRGISTDVISAA